MADCIGKKIWIIPDCELPKPGKGILKGHESVIIVNDSITDARIKVTVYFTNSNPVKAINWFVKSGRVCCFRMNNKEDMCGYDIPFETQYAMKIESSTNIVLQYGRLDNRQNNLSYYTTLGYSE